MRFVDVARITARSLPTPPGSTRSARVTMQGPSEQATTRVSTISPAYITPPGRTLGQTQVVVMTRRRARLVTQVAHQSRLGLYRDGSAVVGSSSLSTRARRPAIAIMTRWASRPTSRGGGAHPPRRIGIPTIAAASGRIAGGLPFAHGGGAGPPRSSADVPDRFNTRRLRRSCDPSPRMDCSSRSDLHEVLRSNRSAPSMRPAWPETHGRELVTSAASDAPTRPMISPRRREIVRPGAHAPSACGTTCASPLPRSGRSRDGAWLATEAGRFLEEIVPPDG